jgi:VCBS repeat-containing protein
MLAAALVVLAPTATSAATTTFSQTDDIAMPLSGGANSGSATPYPSTITVPAGTPVLTSLAVNLEGFSHSQPNDLDMLLVGPTGIARLLMSDAGGAPPNGIAAPGINLRLVVSGSPAIPSNPSSPLPGGTYVPADYAGGTDAFPAPAPASGGVGLAAFIGTSPVGTWSLYIVDDGNGQRGDLLGWSLELGSANNAPVADDDSYMVAEDGTLTVPAGTGVLAGDTDPDADTLTAGSPVGPSNGSLTLNTDGSFTYTPNADFNGSDSFTYTVSDGNGGTDTGLVTITVTAVNDPPVADDDSFSVAEDGTLAVPAGTGVLAGDTDIDGGALSAGSPGAPSSGSVTLNADGSFTYTPDADYVGTDSFTYEVGDGNGGTDTGLVTITVGPNLNDDPVADDDSYSVAEDGTLTVAVVSGVLVGDSDADGGSLTVTSNTAAANGALTVNANGSLTYSPNADFNGSETFTYQVSDGNGGLDTGSVTITVTPVGDPPAAGADTAYVEAGAGVAVAVTANDTDPDGDALSVTLAVAPSRGTASCSGQSCTFTAPADDPGGVVTFSYTASDGNGGTGAATVSVNIVRAAVVPAAAQPTTTTAPAVTTTTTPAVAAEALPVTGSATSALVALAQILLGAGLIALGGGTLARTAPRRRQRAA